MNAVQDEGMAYTSWLFTFRVYCLALYLPTAALADTANYLYDELGQLIGVADSTGVTAVYAYDAVGNLTSIDSFPPPGSGIGIYLSDCPGERPGHNPGHDSGLRL